MLWFSGKKKHYIFGLFFPQIIFRFTIRYSNIGYQYDLSDYNNIVRLYFLFRQSDYNNTVEAV